jgi:hypothetical protein
MKVRKVRIPSGKTFTVPQGVQRIDSTTTHGWQVRYQGTKFFSDGVHGGAAEALAAATRELLNRIATLPAPVTLKRSPSPKKTSDLPAGISGPIVVSRGNHWPLAAIFSVTLPQYGAEPKVKKVYIGTENTYSARRYRAALAEAKGLRDAAVAAYEAAATRARRRAARELKQTLAAAERERGPHGPGTHAES